MHTIFHVITLKSSPSPSFFKLSKKVKIRWRQIWTVTWMFHDFLLQFPEGFQRAGRSMGMGIVVQQQDTL
jgi:hypothetical protein